MLCKKLTYLILKENWFKNCTVFEGCFKCMVAAACHLCQRFSSIIYVLGCEVVKALVRAFCVDVAEPGSDSPPASLSLPYSCRQTSPLLDAVPDAVHMHIFEPAGLTGHRKR